MRELEGVIPSSIIDLLPARFPVIGGAVILQLKEKLYPYKKEIAQAILKYLRTSKSVWLRTGKTEGVFREPKMECIAGDCNPIVLHKEENTLFLLDIARLTFSPGNAGERKKLTRIIKTNEIIVDMFACCGNLSMPIAVNSKPRLVIGIEINPYAYSFLLENIRLNKVSDRYIAILGDNRFSTPENVADHVLMGYFNIDESQLIAGVKALKREGGIIHLHYLSNRLNKMSGLEKYLVYLKNRGVNFEVKDIDKVKSYAPNINHYVARIRINKGY